MRKGERTRQRLFDAAMHLIAEKGYDSVTVEEICQAAQVAKGTFYIYYPTKDDIVAESYYTDMTSYMNVHFAEWVEEHPDSSTYEQIRAFAHLEFVFATYTGVEVCSRAFSINFSECAPNTHIHNDRRPFAQVLRNLVEQAPLAVDKDRAFLDLETVVRGYEASWCFAGGNFDLIEEGDHLFKLTLDGLWAPGAPK